MRDDIKRIILCVVLPLVVGGLLYYIFFPEVIFVKKLDSITNIDMHIILPGLFSKPLRIFRNYFFDLLWAYALACVIYLFIENNARANIWSICGATMLGALLEMLQLFGVTLGTFDIWDIIVECGGAVAGVIIIKTTRRKKQNEER